MIASGNGAQCSDNRPGDASTAAALTFARSKLRAGNFWWTVKFDLERAIPEGRNTEVLQGEKNRRARSCLFMNETESAPEQEIRRIELLHNPRQGQEPWWSMLRGDGTLIPCKMFETAPQLKRKLPVDGGP
ncbi:hypothetical protein DFH09DRAFT_1067771 [Mycena vulgaris]|nr:hypothetical protein DFH09DRAFT_1067771 [Mycena vulgaris]